MFSQAQLNTFGAALDRKRISQATFDEAVQENIEEFDMEVRARWDWLNCQNYSARVMEADSSNKNKLFKSLYVRFHCNAA